MGSAGRRDLQAIGLDDGRVDVDLATVLRRKCADGRIELESSRMEPDEADDFLTFDVDPITVELKLDLGLINLPGHTLNSSQIAAACRDNYDVSCVFCVEDLVPCLALAVRDGQQLDSFAGDAIDGLDAVKGIEPPIMSQEDLERQREQELILQQQELQLQLASSPA